MRHDQVSSDSAVMKATHLISAMSSSQPYHQVYSYRSHQVYYRKLNIINTKIDHFRKRWKWAVARRASFFFIFLPPHDEPLSIGDDPPLLVCDILQYFKFFMPWYIISQYISSFHYIVIYYACILNVWKIFFMKIVVSVSHQSSCTVICSMVHQCHWIYDYEVYSSPNHIIK